MLTAPAATSAMPDTSAVPGPAPASTSGTPATPPGTRTPPSGTPATPPGARVTPSGTRVAHWTTPPTAACVPLIRTRVGSALAAWGISGELRDTLLLTVAELVGNAVRHTAAVTERLHVTVAVVGGRVRLEVEDGDPTPPPAELTALTALAEIDPEAESGRGLPIVALLVAEACGRLSVHAREFGKAVRVCVPVA
ncbi:ATP-binding protein [Streptomyces sp. NPDC051921]|uniref:ATP-binding protein n=1 Tax=Streptomyces sp. NPDC051921 TaxID=3155806 RepID=UPI0034202BFC